MERIADIKEKLAPLIAANGLKLYSLEWLLEKQGPILRISIARMDGTIDLDTCSMMSEQISGILDGIPGLDSQYYLEVCSPGAERKLNDTAEIQAAVDRYVYVKLKNPQAGMDEVQGYLIAADDTAVQIRYRIKTRTKVADIPMENIALIRLAVKL